jgi:fatty acid desaturase
MGDHQDPQNPQKKRDPGRHAFDWMIPAAGIVLVLFATAIFGIFPGNPNNILIAIALFGVGCAALWFGLTHHDTETAETRITRIKARTDRIKEILEKNKK